MNIDLSQRLAERPVLVTGANGFVGSHLTDTLVELGADVHAFVRATSSDELRNLNGDARNLTIHRGDLRDKHSVDRTLVTVFEGSDDGIVFHLGAQAHVGESWERPYETCESNITGTLNLLQSVVDNGIELTKFDTAGTSEEYGNVDQKMRDMYEFASDGGVLLSERSPVNPKSIYATSKLAADFLTMNYYDGYGVPTVTTRMFNNYGPRQNPRYITGTIITQALTRPAIELGALSPKRDMCYVSDGVRGHLHVALEGTAGEQYVYGYGKNISIGDWADRILTIGAERDYWGDDRHVVQRDDRFRPGTSDVEELLVGYEKIHELTGWEPQVSWEEGIARTIDWYANNPTSWVNRVDWNVDVEEVAAR